MGATAAELVVDACEVTATGAIASGEQITIFVGEVPIRICAAEGVLGRFGYFRAIASRSGPPEPFRSAEAEGQPRTVFVAVGSNAFRQFPALPAMTDTVPVSALDDWLIAIPGPPGMVFAMSADHRRAGFWCQHHDARPHWERARPLLPVIQGLLRGTGWTAVHAAGIASSPTGAILLSGASRAGKTSLALRALADGWSYFGDDVVAIAAAESPVRVARIYDTARLRLPPLPGLESLAADGLPSNEFGEDRRELELGHRLASHPTQGIVRNLVHVTRAGAAEPTFGSVSRAAVVSTIVSTTLAISFADLSHLPPVTRLTSLVRPVRFDPGADLTIALDALRRFAEHDDASEVPRP